MITMKKPRTVIKGMKYKHFKGNEYLVQDFSNPNPLKGNLSMDIIMQCEFLDVLHSDGYPIRILINKGRLYHDPKIEKRNLVIYSRVNNPELIYARPLKEFLSEVDRDKYPNVEQQYRFEQVTDVLK